MKKEIAKALKEFDFEEYFYYIDFEDHDSTTKRRTVEIEFGDNEAFEIEVYASYHVSRCAGDRWTLPCETIELEDIECEGVVDTEYDFLTTDFINQYIDM